MGRRKSQKIAVVQEDKAEHGLAQARGTLNDRIKHRLGICRRPGDDVKHLARRSLMFESFGQLARARLYLVEQPHVLDRNYRLVGEGLDQRDLFVGEGLHLQAIGQDHAEQIIPLEHRDRENGPERFDVLRREGIFGVGPRIVDVDRAAFESGTARGAFAAGPDRMLHHPLPELHGSGVVRHHAEDLTIEAVDESKAGAAKAHRTLGYGLKYRPQIEGRAADHFEQIGGGGLLLQAFAQLVEQARVLDGDDGLIGKIRYQLDLLVSEWPDFLTKDGDSSDYLLFLEHRNYDEGPNAAQFDSGDSQWIALKIRFLRAHIENMHRLFGPDYAADGHFRVCTDWHAPACLDHRGRCVMRGGDAKFLGLA